MPTPDPLPGPDDARGGSDVITAYEHAPVALASLGGAEPRFVACNAAYRRLYGGDLRGRRPVEVMTEGDARQLTSVLDRARATGRRVESHEWRFGTDDAAEQFLDVVVEPSGALLHVAVSDATPRVRRQQRTAEAMAVLQDELLPRGLAVLPGLDTAACYLLADPAAARGDWFDCVVRPDDTVALVVGDVVGDGVGAAAAMAQLRAVLHERLASGEPLSAVVTALDRYAATGPEAYGATACVAVVDRTTGAVDYVTAGHPPPVVVPVDGAARHLEVSGGTPLGTGAASVVARHRLGVGEVLLLHTDGLLEREGRPPGSGGIDLLASAEAAVTGGGARRAVVRATHGLLERIAAHSAEWVDDATVLAAQRVGVTAPLELELVADTGARARVADALGGWLRDLDVAPIDAAALEHAVDELVANVVAHAYRDVAPEGMAGSVRVRVRIGSGGVATAAVADAGRWREPDESGHGLAVVRALMDDVVVDAGDHGTEVRASFAVNRPAPLLTSGGRHRSDDVRMDAEPVGECLVVSGPVETRDADRFRTLLYHHAPPPGGREHVVDLTGVTLLGGAGIQALFEVTSRCPGLVLRARPGSVAQQVLDLVRLPYET